VTKIIERGARNAIGKENIQLIDRSSMGSDDFGFYIDQLPSALFRIGCSNGRVVDLHVPDFDVNENCLRTAVRVLYHTTLEYFHS